MLQLCITRHYQSVPLEEYSDPHYTLDEKIIISQGCHRDNLLEKIQVFEQELPETKEKPRLPHTLMLLYSSSTVDTRDEGELKKPP